MSLEPFTSESKDLSPSAEFMRLLRDEELVMLLKNGQQEAFQELHRRYNRRLLACAGRITKSSEDAEDAVQDAFLRAFRGIGGFAGRSSFYTWLTRILINSSLLQLRKRKKNSWVSLEEVSQNGTYWEDAIPDPSVDIEAEYMHKQQLEYLSKAISALNPKLRMVLEIHQSNDCSLVELARLSRLSLPATKSRLLRARAAVQASCSNSIPAPEPPPTHTGTRTE